MKLLATGEDAWTDAADLTGYRRLALRDLLLPEGGADLEYAYDTEERIQMHGVNRMVRVQGRVFLIFWLTTQAAWPADRTLMNMVQPSFGLVS